MLLSPFMLPSYPLKVAEPTHPPLFEGLGSLILQMLRQETPVQGNTGQRAGVTGSNPSPCLPAFPMLVPSRGWIIACGLLSLPPHSASRASQRWSKDHRPQRKCHWPQTSPSPPVPVSSFFLHLFAWASTSRRLQVMPVSALTRHGHWCPQVHGCLSHLLPPFFPQQPLISPQQSQAETGPTEPKQGVTGHHSFWRL